MRQELPSHYRVRGLPGGGETSSANRPRFKHAYLKAPYRLHGKLISSNKTQSDKPSPLPEAALHIVFNMSL